MKLWRWTLLLFELFLFALILVLPDVDLPDFCFHGGTAPIVAKARVSATPVFTPVTFAVQAPLPQFTGEVLALISRPSFLSTSDSLLSLFCTWTC
jgi:hypothetical protein